MFREGERGRPDLARWSPPSRGFNAICDIVIVAFLLFACSQSGAASNVATAPLGLRTGAWLASVFEKEVTPRLNVPREEQGAYARLVQAALWSANVVLQTAQYLLLVDRSPKVQAVFVLWG